MSVIISFDTETPRIGPGQIYPKIICLTWKRPGEPCQIVANDDPKKLEAVIDMLLAPGHILVGANTAYDLQVLYTTFPSKISAIRLKFAANEITDVCEREKLLCLATHGQLAGLVLPDGTKKNLDFSLGGLIKHYTGKDRSEEKDDENGYRMNYGQLDGLKLDYYEQGAIDYAKEDSEDTETVYLMQEERRDTHAFGTEFFQTETAFTLGMGTRNGLRPDPAAYELVSERVARDNADENFEELLRSGILRPAEPARPYARGVKNPDGTPKMKAPVPASINIKILQDIVEAAYKEKGLPVPKTEPSKRNPEGSIARGGDEIKEVMSGWPALIEYMRRAEDAKLVSTYLPMMKWDGQLATTVHAPFRPLVSTGRTSSGAGQKGKQKFPSCNGQNVDPRVRPIFIPRPDHYFVSSDFSSLELVTVAQRTFELFGKSVHLDKINAGYDLHAYLGAQLAAFLDPDLQPILGHLSQDERYHAFLTLKKDWEEKYAFWRKFAKPVGLGFPGGMGPEKFLTLALGDPYNVDLRIECKKYLHLIQYTPKVHYYAYKLGLVSSSRLDDYKVVAAGFKIDDVNTWPAHLQAVGFATLLQNLWLATYPEMKEYFKLVKRWTDSENEGKLVYITPLGMIRRGCAFTDASNGYAMQSPGAEAAKLAWNRYVWECVDPTLDSILFGTIPLLFIHDEIFGEVDIDFCDEQCARIKAIMEEALQQICPAVKVKANPCIMERWSKFAEPIYKDGKLQLWVPKKGWDSVFEKKSKIKVTV